MAQNRRKIGLRASASCNLKQDVALALRSRTRDGSGSFGSTPTRYLRSLSQNWVSIFNLKQLTGRCLQLCSQEGAFAECRTRPITRDHPTIGLRCGPVQARQTDQSHAARSVVLCGSRQLGWVILVGSVTLPLTSATSPLRKNTCVARIQWQMRSSIRHASIPNDPATA